VALFIKSFIGFLSKKGFKVFGYWIAAGIILLIIHFSFTPDYHLMTDEDYRTNFIDWQAFELDLSFRR
jgi:hypothetical protein